MNAERKSHGFKTQFKGLWGSYEITQAVTQNEDVAYLRFWLAGIREKYPEMAQYIVDMAQYIVDTAELIVKANKDWSSGLDEDSIG